MAQSLTGPDIQVIDRIDDAAAELVISRARAIGAMFFKRAAGEAEIAGGFGCAQKPWWQFVGGIAHVKLRCCWCAVGR